MTLELTELLKLVTEAWPRKWTQGRVLHIHQNAVELSDGSKAHVRVLVQQITEPKGDPS